MKIDYLTNIRNLIFTFGYNKNMKYNYRIFLYLNFIIKYNITL
jgi:hypothetical protein